MDSAGCDVVDDVVLCLLMAEQSGKKSATIRCQMSQRSAFSRRYQATSPLAASFNKALHPTFKVE
jgi:hypothetical protein